MKPCPSLRARAVLSLSVLALVATLGGCSWWHRDAAPAPLEKPLAANPQVWMLGEVHDNSAGQRARFAALKRQVEAGWRPVIAMEQFDRDDQNLLSLAEKDCADTACIIRVMAGPRWDWAQYRPVIDLALEYHLPLIAANLSRADASRVVRDGFVTTFDKATLAAYGLDKPLPADLAAAQQREIAAGHCNMLPDSMLGGMVNAQVARDVFMAKIIREQRPRDVVLLAGNGHVRKDIGVARWLNAETPALVVRSEGYLEKGSAAPAGAYDVVHFVAPQQHADPCAGLAVKK